MTDIVTELRNIEISSGRSELNCVPEGYFRRVAGEIERLREFVAFVLREVWDGYGDDTIQDKAAELGLIELRPCRHEDSVDGETEHYFLKWSK